MIERDGLLVKAALPSHFSANGISFSERFSTTTAIRPSAFRKAVVSNSSRVEAAIIRRAPGRMNREKCPM